MRLTPILFPLLILLPQYGAADASRYDASALVREAESRSLADNPEWHKLLHYYSGVFFESQVDDDSFFFSDDGKYDSENELVESIHVLFGRNNTPKNDDHPRCLFVERERWLRDALDLEKSEVPDFCEKYHHWNSQIDAHSSTLVFPASYLNSPSSMFGHTLIRFDPEDIQTDSTWLSYALSYAADTSQSQDDSPYLYAFKGLAGGYPGRFSVVPYFKKIQEYGALENRDVWEYQLNLTEAEVDRMLGHAWELQNVRFDYFYFRENCAFRLLELLDYARPGLRLTDKFSFTAIPADTVKAVVEAGLVSEVHYRPSLGTQVQFNLQSIPVEHRHWVTAVEQDPSVTESEAFSALTSDIRSQIVLTANQFLTYQSRKTAMTSEMAKKRFQMLHLVNRHAVGELSTPVPPERPDVSHDTRVVSLSRGRIREQAFTGLAFRISYHDLLDNSKGYPRGAEITLGDLRLRKFDDEHLQLQSFDVIGIRSLGALHSIFNTISWEVNAGFSRDDDLQDGRIGGKVTGGVGKSALLTPDLQGYAILRAKARVYDKGEKKLFLNPAAVLGLTAYSGAGTTMLELETESIQGRQARHSATLSHNIALSKNNALRLTAVHQQFEEQKDNNLNLEYRHYF